MADKDYRIETSANSIGIHFKLPRIRVPKIFAEDEWGGISFKIETSKGAIKATSSRRKGGIWMCRGDIPSLVASGFIHPDWCPGLPGNNKTRQTVLFENNNPRLVYGNHRGTNFPGPSIVIIRISRNKFEVEVPATKEQSELISQVHSRRKANSASTSPAIYPLSRYEIEHRSHARASRELHEFIASLTESEKRVVGHVKPFGDPANGLKEIRRLQIDRAKRT